MADFDPSTFTPFAKLFAFIDSAVVNVVQAGAAHMISLITPLVAAGFGIYLMLILSSYWRGSNEDPITDFLLRMISWGVVIFIGLNFTNYLEYVVPFINGLGDDLSKVFMAQASDSNSYNSASAVDKMFGAMTDIIVKEFKTATFSTWFMVVFACGIMLVTGGIFLVIATGYILLAKLALGILVTVGPLFIAAALFPATRKMFESWVAQCLNYSFLAMLFSFAAQLQIQMLSTLVPKEFSISQFFEFSICCTTMLFVSLNLPTLAASLAGGVAISSMTGKIRHAAQGLASIADAGKSKSLDDKKNSKQNPQPEQK